MYMPSGSYWQSYVRCPFYKYDDGKKRITCEGIIDASSLALIFSNKADYEIQIMEFCCGNHEMCQVYRLLMDKYDEEEEQMAKNTHCAQILAHMKSKGAISAREAVDLYGCMRLAARINDLRRRGVAIKSEMVNGTDRYGLPCRYAVYSLEEVNKDA
jgi:hypothetical protein